MKKKILIISIISFLGIAIIIGYYIARNKIFKIHASENTLLKSDLLSDETNNLENTEEVSSSIVEEESNIKESSIEETKIEETKTEKSIIAENKTNIEVNKQIEKKETSVQPQSTPVKSSSKTTNNVEKSKVETKIEELKEEKNIQKNPSTKVEVPLTNSETKQETKVVETPERCTNDNNHGMDIGNSGKWFNSKQEAVKVYDDLIKKWGVKWEKFEIDTETYDKNCPYGYEVWSCPFCGKWTINYYYR